MGICPTGLDVFDEFAVANQVNASVPLVIQFAGTFFEDEITQSVVVIVRYTYLVYTSPAAYFVCHLDGFIGRKIELVQSRGFG